MADPSEINRREFLKSGAKAGAGLAALEGITFMTASEWQSLGSGGGAGTT